MTITEFLEARIAEDEEAAQAALRHPAERPDTWSMKRGIAKDSVNDGMFTVAHVVRGAAHIARHDPARVLAECAAKRRIIQVCKHDHELAIDSGDDTTEISSEVLYALAAVYKDHPDYRQEWTL